MALPPTVPTSFVPKQPVATTRRARNGTNLFLLGATLIAAFSILLAAGVFGYEKYLESVHSKKAAMLTQAEASISRDTVEDFIRLRDRLVSAEVLLDEHVAMSQFFDLLESVTAQNVQFSSLEIELSPDRSAKITMKGRATTFNALAVESAAFAAEKRIRRAIFSGISAGEQGGVSFSLTAELDPRLVVWQGPSAAASVAPAIEEEPVETATTTP
ncbi:MAG TPA: hypothetical protein VFY28_03250 [Candidatus Paceibacterota bacterium]|nr:hypothetical protein [Candidatus Paceibacterota bacterium]